MKIVENAVTQNFDKLMNSKNDMQNINYVGGAGSYSSSILQRFILNKTLGTP